MSHSGIPVCAQDNICKTLLAAFPRIRLTQENP